MRKRKNPSSFDDLIRKASKLKNHFVVVDDGKIMIWCNLKDADQLGDLILNAGFKIDQIWPDPARNQVVYEIKLK